MTQMVRCPNCGNESRFRAKFCNGCGHSLAEAESFERVEPDQIERDLDVVTVESTFSDKDAALLDILSYNLTRPGEGRWDEVANRMIIAMGDVENVPSDYAGSIRTTGTVRFSETKPYAVEVRYKSNVTDVCVKAPFMKAVTIKRASEEIQVNTDQARRHITRSQLGEMQMRIFSRTPIAIYRIGPKFYMLCQKKGDYIQDDLGMMDLNAIIEIVPFQEYRIGSFASFTIVL